ncbi:hypothetical protein GKZ68_00635 [Hymenobacter sp. BRD128]|uniref:hypothetical protein n=1 Tax=Hymenobacter sp. BRD128 TaxID=2675878 RepID=UPI0015633A92|nr:hypothetical protein [Hymenobacter sp. BRD128]QKG55272.1 hypothetical protein GKZ68_00635 [Hymenobacter sp. BRD128]
MPLTLVVFASFYPAARHAVHYADAVAQALHGRLVLLHVNRASLFDPYEFIAAGYQRQELERQAGTGAALSQLATGLHSPTTVEIATDLLPVVAEDIASRHRPALFVLSQPDPAYPATASMASACAELLRAGNYPLLVLPPAAPAGQAPRRILLAADREPFVPGPEAGFLRELCALPGTEVVVAHISSGIEDDEGCALALRAVQASGLLAGLPRPSCAATSTPTSAPACWLPWPTPRPTWWWCWPANAATGVACFTAA